MTIIVCSGIHNPDLTDNFLNNLNIINQKFLAADILVITYPQIPVYSPVHLEKFLTQKIDQNNDLFFISFSAGVVGSIGAAKNWQSKGGKIKALIAIDGWGVPLIANFPIYRLSHDYFTHWSLELLGRSRESFYSQPEVEHLTIWNSPHQTWGWWLNKSGTKIRCTAADFVLNLLQKYDEI
ncbi:hypothetical protein STA3757_22000 [Stanieria sp. NIES-3757]|nr:hypothetical protein STA3757_22000 [Stanieria sp. NIES-3757]